MYATKEGLERARQELGNMRSRQASSSGETADMYHNAGDNWHDNPAWHAAQQRQQMMGAQVNRFKNLLELNIQFIEDMTITCDMVGIGCVVTLSESGDLFDLTILGPLEAAPDRNVVSYDAPISKSLIGKTVGEKAEIADGLIAEIVSIKPWRPSPSC